MDILVFSPQGDRRAADAADLPALLASPDVTVWVDMTGPTEADQRAMRDVFRFHPLAIEDTVYHEQRPKVEEYEDHVFVLLNAIDFKTHALVLREVDIFVGRNYVVTVHKREEPAVTEARRRVSSPTRVMPISASYLLYVVMDSIIDSYLPIFDVISGVIEDIEDDVLKDARQQTLARLFQLKRAMIDLWRVVWPQREILNNLMHHKLAYIDQDAIQYYLRDVSDHLLWLTDMVNTFRDHLTGITDLYMSAVSNRLNRVVNRLAVYALVIGVFTVITAFYGMNFVQVWPSWDAPWGAVFVVGAMAVSTIVLLVLAKRRGWL